MLALDLTKEVAATLRTPNESSMIPAVAAAAQTQVLYPYMKLPLRPLITKPEQPLVLDNPIRVVSIPSTTEHERPRMPYAPMKHMLASPDRLEQPRMPNAPMTVPPASSARRYGSPKNPCASVNPDMPPSVCLFRHPRVPNAQRKVALGVGISALAVEQRFVPYPPGKPIKIVSADQSEYTSRECIDSKCPVRTSHRAGGFTKTSSDLPLYIEYLEARLGDIKWLIKPQKNLPGVSSVSHFEALNHDMFYLVHDMDKT